MGEGNNFENFETISYTITIVAILFTILTIFLIFFVGYWINTEKNCGTNEYTHYGGTPLAASSYVLTNSTDSLLQRLELTDHEDMSYSFCFTANTTAAQKIDVITQNASVAGTGYALSGKRKTCIDASLNTGVQYLGVQCTTCTQSTNMTLYDEISGKNTIQIYTHNGVVVIENSKIVDYTINTIRGCKFYISIFLRLWALLIFFLGMALFIIVGFNRLKDILSGDFGGGSGL